jgi:hypothetical protein
MPGLARWAGWLIVCTLPAIVLAGSRAAPLDPGILFPAPSSAGAPAAGPPPAGVPGDEGPPALPADVAALALAAFPGPGLPVFAAAEPAIWPSTCLGLAPAGAICGQAIVPGWIVTLVDPQGSAAVVHVGAGVARLAEGP